MKTHPYPLCNESRNSSTTCESPVSLRGHSPQSHAKPDPLRPEKPARFHWLRSASNAVVASCLVLGASFHLADAQPALVDPHLSVRPVIEGLEQPIGMAFLGPNDFLVIEKASGQVKRVVDGATTGVVLDLAVNSASERGLLGIALHPQFPARPWVYLYWTESTTGADSDVTEEVPLLGNRVDRFVWDASAQSLTFDMNLISLRAFQEDDGRQRGNHDGGVIRFGPDDKIYS